MTTDEEPLVRVDRVSKKYCRSLRRSLWYGLRDIGAEVLGRSGSSRLQLRRDEFVAVDDVSFEIRRGECLGLVGANGAGKSTVLKLLNGLVRPDAGRIEIRGRVGALIELGAGFNPVLTGRENVYVNGSVLGLKKREIDRRLEEIVEFAELADFIDAPVQTYSSGMRVRLGFAVAAHLEPDVLLIDEVLAVGDMSFVLKCFNAMEKQLSRSAMVFVSHNMPQVVRACTRAVCLERGRMIAEGATSSVIGAYLSRLVAPAGSFVGEPGTCIDRTRFVGEDDDETSGKPFVISYLDDLEIEFSLSVPGEHRHPVVFLVIYDRELRGVGETLMSDDRALTNTGLPLRVRVTLPRLHLSKGVYSLTLGVKSSERGRILGRFQSVRTFQVEGEHAMWLPICFESRFEQLA